MRLLPFLAAVLMPCATLAQGVETGKDIVLAGRDFQERLGETSKVSGDIIMGVMLTTDAPGAAAPAITTGRPPDWTTATDWSPVCVRLVSKDGNYEAENTYMVRPGYGAAVAPFPYLGKHAADLAARKAVALVRAGRCGSRNQPVLPSLWRGPEQADPTLHVYLNTAGNPATVAIGRRGELYSGACENVAELTGLKYTAHCAIPLDRLPAGAEPLPLSFFVTRANTEEVFQTDLLRVLPDE